MSVRWVTTTSDARGAALRGSERMALANARQARVRVDGRPAARMDLEVQVRRAALGVTAVPHIAHAAPGSHVLAGRHRDLGQVGVVELRASVPQVQRETAEAAIAD